MNEDNATENLETQVTETEPETLISGTTETTTEESTTTEETPEAKAEREAAEAAEAARQAPITVEDLALPEGFETTDELRSEFVETINSLKDLGPKEQAEALINLQAKAMTAASEASSAAWDKLQTEWRDEVKAEYGDKLQPTLNSINRLVTEHGDEKLVEALAVTGAGNHPEVVKFFSKMAGLLTEGSHVSGVSSGQEKTAAQKMFPSMTGN